MIEWERDRKRESEWGERDSREMREREWERGIEIDRHTHREKRIIMNRVKDNSSNEECFWGIKRNIWLLAITNLFTDYWCPQKTK